MRYAERFTGTPTLVRLILRRDRVRLPVWVVSIVGLVGFSANAVQGVYGTAHDRAVYAETVGRSSGSIALAGPPVGLRTIGGVTIFETSATALIAIALMAIFLTVRHTRAEEEAERTELMRAGRLGRLAPLAAAGLTISAASVLIGLGIAGSFIVLGLPARGSWAFGASVAVFGVCFTGVALVAAQVTEHARAASGGAAAVLAVVFALRAVGDVGWSPLSWWSPMGWSQAVRPYVDDRWWPLLISLTVGGVLVFAAQSLVERRDLGAGLVPTRLGVSTAGPRLSTAWGLAIRLQRASVVGWSVGLGLGGAAFGSISGDLNRLIEDRPELKDVLVPGGGDITDGYLATMALILALVAGGFTVASTLRLRSEETARRVEPLLATRLSRLRWAAANLSFMAVSTALVLAIGGAGLGASSAIATHDAGRLVDSITSALLYLPAGLLVAGIALVLIGWLPRAAASVWTLLAACFVIGYLGPLFNLPSWMIQSSPYSHIPSTLTGDVTIGGPLALLALTAAAGAIGLSGLRRRDLV